MNLDKALAAHADWKVKLRMAINDKGKLDAETLSSDCKCDLGRWLKGEGRASHGADPAFGACMAGHTAFHTAAGTIARAINQGDFAAAERLIGQGSAFAQASTQVAVAIRRLKQSAPA
ncbi:MAG: CZB domain-containing protein [Proteobacteria bacterium]|nr:CZB domain-containing protein [Pseudomonadota bacterium]